MAHFSGDAGLARIFACEGADPFRLLAAQWLGVAEAEVGRGGGARGGLSAGLLPVECMQPTKALSRCWRAAFSVPCACPAHAFCAACPPRPCPTRSSSKPTHSPTHPAARCLPPHTQVSQQQRDHAKQLTYGLLYGMGPARLADELGCGVAEARAAQVGQGRADGRLPARRQQQGRSSSCIPQVEQAGRLVSFHPPPIKRHCQGQC
jgi:hypothetical protein